MKESYQITRETMKGLLEELGKTYCIWGPKRVGKFIRYGELGTLDELVYREKSHFSPKEVFYPILQTLLYFSDHQVQESVLSDEREILLFLRPCDVNGIRRLDTIFMKNGGQADPYYRRRREKIKFFLLECAESFETCFCVSMGSSRTDDYAAAFRFGEEEVKLQLSGEGALQEKMAALLAGESLSDFTPQFVTENKRKVAVPDISHRGLVKEIHELPMWREFDERCIGCGGCNTVCITCSCFDTTDVIYHETSRDGERRRAWSSCMLESYSAMAGGHNVRSRAGDRMRFKAMHKTYDFKVRFGEENMCVGCGRCDMRCPKEIHFSETVDRLAHEVERLKKESGPEVREQAEGPEGQPAVPQEKQPPGFPPEENQILPGPHRILRIIHETTAEYTFRVQCDDPVNHGQFYVLSIPKVGEAPISVSARGEGYVEFTIRKVGKLTDGIFGMAEGDTLFMRGPYGNAFPVEDFKGKPLAVIAGGTGMAPVRSMLQYFYNHPKEAGEIYLIVGFKDRKAVLFEEDLARFREKFHTVYCLDHTEAEGFQKGFVTEYVKEIPFDTFGDYNVVIVGPPAMISFTARECVARGAAQENIWVSFERKMSCSLGKCGHCKINETYVCQEGPVFRYTRARELLD